MNKLNVRKAITIIERARDANKVLDMGIWQGENGEEVALYEINCDTPCCFAGYVAISNEFQADGGSVDQSCGSPIYKHEVKTTSIRLWLDISPDQANSLCGLGVNWAYDGLDDENITFDNVIDALVSLHNTGLLPYEPED